MPAKTLLAVAGPLVAVLLIAAPASAQHHGRYRDRDRDDDRVEDVLIGAAVGALAGAILGEGDGSYVLGGALAGAALGSGSGDDDCNYYRGGRCYRNQGHWEREHGIDSRDGYDRRELRRYELGERRDDRRDRRW